MQFTFLVVSLLALLYQANADNHKATVTEVTTSSLSFRWQDGEELNRVTMQNTMEEDDRRVQNATETEFESLKNGAQYIVTFSSPGLQNRSSVVVTAQCPLGWRGYRNSCYKRVEKDVVREQAERECMTFFPSAHLVDPRTQGEFEFITSTAILPEDGARMYWIGITTTSETTYVYTDGTNVAEELMSFRRGKMAVEPKCVALNPPATNWAWIQTQCDVSAHFICEYPVPRPPRKTDASHGSTTASVTWEPPVSEFGSAFSGYFVELRKDVPTNPPIQHKRVLSGEDALQFSGLNAGHLYFASVIAEQQDGGGASAKMPDYAFVTYPYGPTDVLIIPGYNKFDISWNEPNEADDNKYDEFVVTVDKVEGLETESISRTLEHEITIADLMPHTTYEISVDSASTHNTTYAELQQTTNEVYLKRTRVSPVFNFRVRSVTLGETVFTVVWEAAMGSVDHYELNMTLRDLDPRDDVASPRILTVSNETLHYEFGDLKPGKTYEVTISSVKEEEKSKELNLLQTTRPMPLNEWRIRLNNQTVDTATFQISPATLDGVFDGYRLEFQNQKSDHVMQHDFGRKSEFLVAGDLIPGSKYEVSAYTKSKGVTSSPSYRMAVSLGVAAPENFRFLSRNETSILLGWDSSRGEVTSYLLTCDNCPGDDAEVIGRDEKNEFVFRDLQPGDEYPFTIQARNEETNVSPSRTIRYVTRTLPNSPQLGPIDHHNETTMIVRWSRPSGTKDGYLVKYNAEEGQTSTVPAKNGSRYFEDDGTEEFVAYLSDLNPGTYYAIAIHTVAGDTYSRPAGFSLATKPNMVQNIHIIESGEYWCYFSWTPGVGGYENFVVQLHSLPSDETIHDFTTNATEFRANLPKAATLYLVTVQTIASGSWTSMPVKRYFMTRPLSVTDVEIYDVAEQAFAVRWNPPKSNYDEVRVMLSRNSIEQQTDTTKSFVVFNSLIPGARYDLEIFATFNRTNSHSVSQRVTLFPLPPLGLISTGTTSTSLSISWDKPLGEVETYFLTWSPPDEANQTEIEVREEIATLVGLTPGVAYTISVYSRNQKNVGSPQGFTMIELTTDEQYPGAPISVKTESVTPTMLRVMWEETATPNGIILQYVIRYRQIYPHPNSLFSYQNVSASLTETAVRNLEPGAYYGVSVKAQNSKGPSNWTDLLFHQNLEAIPGVVTDLKALTTEIRSLDVSWKVPLDPNGDIQEYVLTVRNPADEEIGRVTFARDLSKGPLTCFEDTEPLATALLSDYKPANASMEGPLFASICPVLHRVDGLSPYTEYDIAVQAHTSQGGGNFTSIRATTMEELPSGPPRNITVSQVGPDTITLQWNPPERPNGVLAYRIRLLVEENYITFKTNETSYTLTDLEPFSTYGVTMMSFTGKGTSESTDLLFLNTTEDTPGAPKNLSGKVLNSKSTYLSWSPPYNPRGIVLFYEVEIRNVATNVILRADRVNASVTSATQMGADLLAPETDQNQNVPFEQDRVSLFSNFGLGSKVSKVQATTFKHVVRDLRPYTDYEFAVRAATSAGAGYAAFLTLKTVEDRPGSSPTNLHYKNLTSTSVNLTWSEPEDPNGEIIAYSIMYISEVNEMRTELSNKTYVVLENLLKNSLYSVYVNSKTSVGGGPSSEGLQMYTDEDVPESPPMNVKYFNITPTAVRLTWSPPETPNGVITSYTVYYRNSTGELSETSDTTGAILENLKVYGEYWIRIAARTKYGDGGQRSAPLYVRTGEGQPGTPPLHLSHVNLGSTGVRLLWQKPEEPNGIIQHYEITIRASDADKDISIDTPGAQTEFVVRGLTPDTMYTIHVKAHTKHGDGGQTSEPIAIQTLEDAPGTPPRNLRYENISSTSVFLTWDDPEIPNGKLQLSTITYSNISFTTIERKAVLEDLSPFTAYDIKVSASTEAGEGPQATMLVYTDEDEPSSPPHEVTYTQISSTAISLSWLPPLTPNGVIVSYEVKYFGKSGEKSITTNETSVALSGLEKFARYTATVSAATRVGNGNQYSPTIMFQTLEDAPSDPPYNVTVMSKTSTSLELSWLPPKNPNGVIQFYTIYLVDDDKNLKKKKAINQTSSVVDDLYKYSWYNVSIAASTGLGDGNQRSKTLRIRTLPGAPDFGVQSLMANSINSTAIRVSWSPPAPITGIIAYSIGVYVAENEKYIDDVNTTESEIEIGHLMPFKEYMVKVTAWEQITESSGPDKSAVVKTWEGAPGEPVTNLRVVDITHKSVELAWNQTPKPNGIVVSYIINIPNGNIIKEIPALDPDSNITIGGLEANSQYEASVSPKTKAGVGPSAWTNFTTTLGVPADPPTNVEVHFTANASNVMLSWKRPQIPNGEIVSYKVVYRTRKLAEDFEISAQTNDAETEYLLTGLIAHTAYSVVLSGSTRLGDGPQSESVEFRTMEDVPGAPLLQCSVSGNSSVHVAWKLLQPNGDILSFELEHHPEFNPSSTTKISLENDAQNRNISELSPNSYYIFKLWAVTKPGDGQPATCRVKTDEGLASAPEDLNLTNSTSTTLAIKWHAPVELNGALSHYVLFYAPPYECWANGGTMVSDNLICKIKVDALKREKTLIALRNYAAYAISVAAVTGAGIGERGQELTFTTKPGVPTYEPRNVEATDASSTAVNVSWVEPLYLAGPTSYQAKIYLENELVKSSEVVSSNSTFVIVDGLDEDTLFAASVFAITSAGFIESKKMMVRTEEDAPSDPPSMLEIKTIPGNSSSVSIEFLPPSDPNGPIFEYDLQYKLLSEDDAVTINILDEDLPYTGEPLVNHSIPITGFLGGRTYYFKMRAGTLIGFGPWTKWSDPITLPVNPPPIPMATPQVNLPSELATKSTSTLNVDICVFSFVNGPLANITIIVAEVGADFELDPLHWFQAYYRNPSPPYSVLASNEPTDFCGENGISLARQKRSVQEDAKNFVLGQDDFCIRTREPYCNGPLKSNTPYRMKIRGTATNGDFTETEYSKTVRTSPTFLDQHLYLLVGLGVGIVVFVFVVSITVRCCRKSLRSQSLNDSQRSSRNSCSLSKRTGGDDTSSQHNLSFVMEPTNARGSKAITRPVAKAAFSAHVSRMSEHNDKGFLSEFDEIESVTPFGPKNIGSQSCNASKNRYPNIIPYDHYRVKIGDIAGIEGSSYINASYIPGVDSPEHYIATQAPLGHTKNDFWRMVWETGSQKIVMLCGVEQDGKDNIAKYWPALSQTTYFGNLAVQCLLEERKPEWTIRTFSMAKRDKRRKVAQYHFTLWPVRGVPDNPHPFARFLHATRSRKKAGDRPLVVMCSSGSGRTAVYITVDLIVDTMAKENRIDPCGVVSELRNYRPVMVQTVAEYSFLHRCLAHLISQSDAGKHSVRSPTGDGVEETTMF